MGHGHHLYPDREGFAYLAVVIDLYSRRVIGWAMQSRQTTDVVLQALLMAVWRRKPKDQVLVHSDQGSQFTRMDWASFLKHHNLVHSPLGDTLYRLPGRG
jgi:putative transposase